MTDAYHVRMRFMLPLLSLAVYGCSPEAPYSPLYVLHVRRH